MVFHKDLFLVHYYSIYIYATFFASLKISNHGNNILGLFDALPNVPFTTKETNRDC